MAAVRTCGSTGRSSQAGKARPTAGAHRQVCRFTPRPRPTRAAAPLGGHDDPPSWPDGEGHLPRRNRTPAPLPPSAPTGREWLVSSQRLLPRPRDPPIGGCGITAVYVWLYRQARTGEPADPGDLCACQHVRRACFLLIFGVLGMDCPLPPGIGSRLMAGGSTVGRVEHAAYPPKPGPGDQVAVLSPSAGLPEVFPRPFELGLARLRDEFGLVPVEYLATRRMGASGADRAAGIHAAFADPGIAAVIASIGGDDQITVLPHLDAGLLRAHPKPFFGYSDNTCLLAYLASLGIVGYHGGSVMVEFGRPAKMHPVTAASLRAALFTPGGL
jgi:hypothetical protein